MDKVTLVYEPSTEYARERMGPVTLTIPHGDVWTSLVDDFVAFLRLTGYHIGEPWVDEYSHHKRLGEKAAKILSELEYDEETGKVNWERVHIGNPTSEDEVESTTNNGRNPTSTRRSKREQRSKRRGRKAKK